MEITEWEYAPGKPATCCETGARWLRFIGALSPSGWAIVYAGDSQQTHAVNFCAWCGSSLVSSPVAKVSA